MLAPTSAIALEQFTTFGDLLKYLRRRAGLTQRELSIAVGYSDAQVSRLEQNQRLPDVATLTARFVPALSLEDEPEVVKRLLELAAAVRREDAPAAGLPPFKGLYYFDEADADWFFGREALVAKLLARLTPQPPLLTRTSASGEGEKGVRFLAVVGASGSGKSSIVRAGLVPALRWNPASANWLIHVLTPTTHPLEALAASLARETGPARAITALVDDMARNPRALHSHVARMLSKGTGAQGGRGDSSPPRLLLVVDQFEELFTLCRSDAERSGFVDNLLTAAFEPDGLALVVIALRADFYAHCAAFPRLREALSKYQEYIGPMTAEELRRAIEEPARCGHWELEAGLVELLLKDVGDEPGALPLLSHALLETWRRRRSHTLTLSGYLAAGGVRGAIAETAEAVFNDQLDQEQRVIACHIFLRLTELGEGTQDTRRRASLSELITNPQLQASVESVLKTLADARLITVGEDSAEVAHEALIREWPTLREWLSQNREDLRVQRHLTGAAREWEKLNHDSGALYRGARLAQALEWVEWAGHRDDLNALEREFLLASKALAEREAAEHEAQRQRELDAVQRAAEAAQKLAAEAEARRQAEADHAREAERSTARLRTRNRLITGLGAMAFILAMAALLFGVQSNRYAVEAERNAATVQAASTQAAEQARLARSNQLLRQASARWQDKQFDLALLLNLAVAQASDTFEARRGLFTALADNPRLTTLRGHSKSVTSVAFSPDGKTLASSSTDNTIILWDAAVGARRPMGLPLTGHKKWVSSVTFSPAERGQTLASGDADGLIILWDAAARQPLGPPLAGHTRGINGLAFSPDGKLLASGSDDHTLILWDVATRQPLGPPLIGHTSGVNSLAFSPDGQTLASGSGPNTIILWDVTTRQPLGGAPLVGHSAPVTSLAFSPDGRVLASGSGPNTIILWDVATRQRLGPPLTGHTKAIWSIAFSPDGKTLASGSLDNTIILWDVVAGARQPISQYSRLIGHTRGVNSIAFSPDGKTLASGGRDAAVILWNVASGAQLLDGPPLTGHAGGVWSVAFSPAERGKTLASGGEDRTGVLWDVATRQPLGPLLIGHSLGINSVAFSPDGKVLATGSDDETVILWDVLTGQPLGPPLTGHLCGLAFSPDGKILAMSRVDNTIILWDVKTRQLIGPPLAGHAASINGLAFSPDSRLLASGSVDNAIILWDMATHQPLGSPLTGHTSSVGPVAFSPDGQTLASGSGDNTIILWDVAARQPLGPPLIGHTGEVYSLAFSPDGQTLASGSKDNTIILWDVAAREPLGPLLTGHLKAIWSVAFSPDGNRLASGSEDGTIRLWDVSFESWQARACEMVGRNFTREEWDQYFPGEPYRKVCAAWPEGE